MRPRSGSVAIAVGWVMACVLQGTATAKPEYAQKEKMECSFCHVNPVGGGERNAHGQYYARNNHSLKGLPVEFKRLWKLEAPAEARRVGLGDVLGTKTPQVLVLGPTDELSVYEVTESALNQVTTVKLGPRAKEFAVGVFQKNKPAMVAVPGAIFYRSGDAAAQVKAPALTAISGVVRFVDGEECVFHFDGMNEPSVFGVNLGATNPLTIGQSMVMPDQASGIYSWVVARFPADAIAALGWPPEVAKSPAIGMWDARNDGNLLAWAVWSDTKGSKLVLIDPGRIMGGGEIKPVWSSEPLSGKVLDVTLGLDPKNGKVPGFLVLTASADGKGGRTLEFLGLD